MNDLSAHERHSICDITDMITEIESFRYLFGLCLITGLDFGLNDKLDYWNELMDRLFFNGVVFVSTFDALFTGCLLQPCQRVLDLTVCTP